jgi:hypothetical protein
MLTRRNFVLTGLATGICAPAIVRANVLMPVRRVVLPPDASGLFFTPKNYDPFAGIPHYGFVERLYVNVHLPKIAPLFSAGRSADEIATVLNRSGSRAMNGVRWSADSVRGIVRRDEAIREADLEVKRRRASLLRKGGSAVVK